MASHPHASIGTHAGGTRPSSTASSRTPRSSRLWPCSRWSGRIWMKPNATNSAVVAVLRCCTDRLVRRPCCSVRRGPRAWMWRLYCLYRYGVQLLSVDDVAVITAIKHQGAFHVAFATVHRGSRRPQMSAIARPKRLTTSEGGTSSRKHAEHSSAAEGGDLLKVRMPAIECATSRVGVKWMA
jgi:hypothetical protein